MKKNVIRKLDEIQEKLYAASDKIWNEPEIAFQEYKSMDVLCKLLEEEGFSIEKKSGWNSYRFSGCLWIRKTGNRLSGRI